MEYSKFGRTSETSDSGENLTGSKTKRNKWFLAAVVVGLLIILVVTLTFCLLPSPDSLHAGPCAGRCGAPSDPSWVCQCNAECEERGDCCPDYAILCSHGTASCVGRCGDDADADLPCQCNSACGHFGDCCADFGNACSGNLSCIDRCGAAYNSSWFCQCNSDCDGHGDCCSDYNAECGTISKEITDQDIADLGQKIWDADVDKVAVKLSLQGQIQDGSKTDSAKNPLFDEIPPEVNSSAIYKKFTALFDDYIPDDSVSESMDANEWAEVDDFLTEAMKSEALKLTHKCLASKGVVSSNETVFQEELKQIWYWLYNRSNTLNSSSGGEHVLVGEVKSKGRRISGLHNWVRFALLEKAGKINYLGYVNFLDFNGTYIIRNPFFWDENYKPVGGFFVGTSPAFDLSVYTLCFFARPNSGYCTLRINGNDIKIQTFTMDSYGRQLVGSSYPNF